MKSLFTYAIALVFFAGINNLSKVMMKLPEPKECLSKYVSYIISYTNLIKIHQRPVFTGKRDQNQKIRTFGYDLGTILMRLHGNGSKWISSVIVEGSKLFIISMIGNVELRAQTRNAFFSNLNRQPYWTLKPATNLPTCWHFPKSIKFH